MVISGVTAKPSAIRRRARIEPSPAPRPYPPHRRVREEVRDGLAVVAASAGASTAVALIATLMVKLVG